MSQVQERALDVPQMRTAERSFETSASIRRRLLIWKKTPVRSKIHYVEDVEGLFPESVSQLQDGALDIVQKRIAERGLDSPVPRRGMLQIRTAERGSDVPTRTRKRLRIV